MPSQVVTHNAAITTFAKLKKLDLNETKCARIHIAKKKCDQCAKIFVNGRVIRESQKEKYLGDYLTQYANPKATMQDRKERGHGILSNMKAILEDIPLGSRRFQIGLTLRESWFLNGTLYNSEVWCSYNKSDLKVLEVLDRKILRLILNSHSKSPSEILYLETGCLPIKDVITVRRLSYLHTILERSEDEIIKKVYLAQKKQPSEGDWVKLVDIDKKDLDMMYEDSAIARMSSEDYLDIVKSKVRQKAFAELRQIQQGHEKVRHIQYDSLSEPQEYLCHKMSNNRISRLLFNLRCQTVKNIKNNFHKQFENNLGCPFKCFGEIDSQENLLSCKRLRKELNSQQENKLNSVSYNQIFGNVQEQQETGKVFQMMLKIRDRLLRKDQEPAHLGNYTGACG